MKKGFLGLFAVGALALGGCFVSDPEGTFSLTWSISVDGFAGTCAEVGGDVVQVIATNNNSGDGFSDTFRCNAFAGTTAPMPTGDYTVVIKLLDNSNHQLNSVNLVMQHQLFDGDNVGLGNFQFAFVFPKVRFTVAMGNNPNGNCSEAPGAANAAFEEIRVSDTSASACIPFDIIGVTDAQNHLVTEETCSPFLCQFRNTVHAIAGVDPGNYLMQVIGTQLGGGTVPFDCYISDPVQFTLGGSDVNLGSIVARPISDLRCHVAKPQDVKL